MDRPEMSNGAAHDFGASIFINAQDGLRLHVREYGRHGSPPLPVVCLPGLTRTVADFDILAPALARDRGLLRRVIAIDSRGRGLSDYDLDPANYNLAVELADVVTVLSTLAIDRAIFVGSSRGGILTMLMALAHPARVAGAVLHDIGPVIELKGLMRIKSYVGKFPKPRNFSDGAAILRTGFQDQFPKLNAAQWTAAAHRAWRIDHNELVPTYDVRLAETLAGVDFEHPLPPLWNEFDALARVPVLVIRGAISDVLSAATVTAMHARHPSMEAMEVADQGHVPLLEGDGIIRPIVEFVGKCQA